MIYLKPKPAAVASMSNAMLHEIMIDMATILGALAALVAAASSMVNGWRLLGHQGVSDAHHNENVAKFDMLTMQIAELTDRFDAITTTTINRT